MKSKEIRQYRDTIVGLLDGIEGETDHIVAAASVMAAAIERGELIYVIGTGGHSCMAAEELLWRAGGLAAVNPILDAGVNLIHGAKRSNVIERCEGYGRTLFDTCHMGEKEGEVLLIVNAYGINAMTIDVALEAKKRGMTVIGVTSDSFAKQVPKGAKARHSSNLNLYQIVDIYIDNHLPYGDAAVEVEGLVQKIAPTSTFCNAFAVNAIVIETIKLLIQHGAEPPVWVSANLPGGDEANKKWEDLYRSRVRHL